MKRTGRSAIRRWTTDRLVRRALNLGTSRLGWEAVVQLQGRGSPATLHAIERLLLSPNPRRRTLGLDIAAQLGRGPARGGEAATPYALEATQALLVRGLDDANAGVLAAAIVGLGHRPAPSALPALLAHESHPDQRVRLALAHALAGWPGPEATGALMRLAVDRDDSVRDWATFSLGTLSEADDDAIRSLLWDNAHDPDRDVRGEAVVGLARRSDSRVIALLQERLADDDCRIYELEAAQEMPRAELLQVLQRVREDADRLPDLDPYWYGRLLDAIDACELVADAAA